MSLTTKLPTLLLLSLCTQFSFGQNYSVHKKNKSYFGVTGGMNFTFPKVTDHYAVLTSIGSTSNESLQKKYDPFLQNRGVQFGIRYAYNFTNSLSIQAGFGYQSQTFGYFTNYSWADTLNNQNFDREMHHLQKISYFTLPIMARWDFTEGQLKPYAQGGIFMDFRHQGKKVINYDNTIDEEETESQISSSGEVSITDYTQKFNIGLMGGIGVSYYTKYVTFSLESNFKYGFLKTMNNNMRYSDYNGFALQYLDVFDQTRMSVWNVQFTISVPLSNSINSNILRRSSYHKKR